MFVKHTLCLSAYSITVRIGDDIGAVHLHKIGLDKKSRLARAGTTDYQHIFIAGMGRILRPAGHHKPLGLRQDNVVFRFRVHKRGNICFVAP